jgi:hypothetical protein
VDPAKLVVVLDRSGAVAAHIRPVLVDMARDLEHDFADGLLHRRETNRPGNAVELGLRKPPPRQSIQVFGGHPLDRPVFTVLRQIVLDNAGRLGVGRQRRLDGNAARARRIRVAPLDAPQTPGTVRPDAAVLMVGTVIRSPPPALGVEAACIVPTRSRCVVSPKKPLHERPGHLGDLLLRLAAPTLMIDIPDSAGLFCLREKASPSL